MRNPEDSLPFTFSRGGNRFIPSQRIEKRGLKSGIHDKRTEHFPVKHDEWAWTFFFQNDTIETSENDWSFDVSTSHEPRAFHQILSEKKKPSWGKPSGEPATSSFYLSHEGPKREPLTEVRKRSPILFGNSEKKQSSVVVFFASIHPFKKLPVLLFFGKKNR